MKQISTENSARESRILRLETERKVDRQRISSLVNEIDDLRLSKFKELQTSVRRISDLQDVIGKTVSIDHECEISSLRIGGKVDSERISSLVVEIEMLKRKVDGLKEVQCDRKHKELQEEVRRISIVQDVMRKDCVDQSCRILFLEIGRKVDQSTVDTVFSRVDDLESQLIIRAVSDTVQRWTFHQLKMHKVIPEKWKDVVDFETLNRAYYGERKLNPEDIDVKRIDAFVSSMFDALSRSVYDDDDSRGICGERGISNDRILYSDLGLKLADKALMEGKLMLHSPSPEFDFFFANHRVFRCSQ